MCPGNASKELFTAKPPSSPRPCRVFRKRFGFVQVFEHVLIFLGGLGVLAVQDFSMVTRFHVISP
jgi:hypothetical protein